MKKLLSLALVLILTLALFAGCTTPETPDNGSSNEGTTTGTPSDLGSNTETPDEPKDDTVVRVAGLNGPTTMGIVKLMADSEEGKAKNKYAFNIYTAATEITPLLAKGELDIALIPANLAANLYNKTDKSLQVLAINTLGVVYVVEKGNSVNSVADLKGKTIYAPATLKGAAPELAFRYILKSNGLDPDKDVTFEWKSEPTEIVATLKKAESGIALVPQPFATVAAGSVEGLRTVIDVNAEWDKLGTGSAFITGVAVVRREFAEAHPTLIKNFLEEYGASIAYINENTAEAAQLVEKNNITKAAVAEKAIPKCNITFIEGAEMKTKVEGFLKVLFDMKPEAVGGTMPGDDFYYESK